ncbi:MAG: hypothetical protein RL088_4232 [Verrucomicrobiota bacterium]|jgi:hypothetical protein
MKKTALLSAIALAGALLPSTSNAALLVEQWMGAGNSGLAGVDAAIASRPADYSGVYNIIDFTDDPAGFAGLIPGSVFWPSAGGLNLGTGHPLNTNFGARVSGTVSISTADTYTFRTFADDGVRLRIGGTTVISDNSYHPETQLLGSIFLTPGTYSLDLIFFEGGGEASLEFAVQQGAGPFGHVGQIGGPTSTSTVPDGGSGVALLGLALSALAGFRRKFAI